MENSEEMVFQYVFQRVARSASAEHWFVQEIEEFETIGEAIVMYEEDTAHIILTLEAEHLDNSDVILDELLETLGVDNFVCTLSETKEEVYSDDDLDECDCEECSGGDEE